jgi:hypothetical protein
MRAAHQCSFCAVHACCSSTENTAVNEFVVYSAVLHNNFAAYYCTLKTYYRYCKLALLLLLPLPLQSTATAAAAVADVPCKLLLLLLLALILLVFTLQAAALHIACLSSSAHCCTVPAHCCYCSVHIAVAYTLQLLLLLLSLSLHAAASELAVVYTQNSQRVVVVEDTKG